MKRSRSATPVLLAMLCCFALLLDCCRSEQASLLVGRAAPDFSTTWLGGGEIRLGDVSGRPVLLELWAPWCPACLKNIEPLNEVHRAYGDRLQVIALSAERGQKTLETFVNERRIAYPVAFSDRRIVQDYGAMSIPVTVLVDKTGIVRHHGYGVVSFHRLERLIRDLL
ncbi:TlpA family protein disulfide reductase [Desulfofustis glycolicus]|uniref:Cytochrome c biogenesis protein CcmG, thiol:disulfide interchange protein DsbE n=1 Tax=Desulfofustis glycolicus DSM 9705 TaxID=1121409 RepID=A0A1M5YN26_9BACT|nr:TlpA disulfide reductase family protein [Desulfofustis glycolicus]MCB2218395.1 TlpA family protein disulfide reductase [Desulfobulbaceae bacterium]SHI13224.1 cytochrome c biogenesis protein CcmG, thiol:disulfide interchange protein DsbE [Desulfofustis glycolicus DSM 9705]